MFISSTDLLSFMDCRVLFVCARSFSKKNDDVPLIFNFLYIVSVYNNSYYDW